MSDGRRGRSHADVGSGEAREGRLARKVALVTGGGRGIGRGIALEFAAEGASVVVVSRTQAALDAVAAEIRASGGSALALTCDVGNEEEVRRVVSAAVAEFGTVDVLANVAQGFSLERGSGLRTDPLESFPEEEWDYIFQTGLKATLYTMKAVFSYMRERGYGKIINFGSEVGQKGGHAAYAANKEGIRALTRSAARAWGVYGINVNVINPVIETESSSYVKDPNLRDQVEKTTALQRIAKPRECGRVAVFLASHDSDYLTGMTFMVDGGRFMFA